MIGCSKEELYYDTLKEAKMWDKLFSAVDGLSMGTNATWLRNEVISNNIANADTPGFKVSQVRFEDIMASAISSDGVGMKTARSGHEQAGLSVIGDVQPVVTTDTSTSYRIDGNNVDAEAQMTALAQNSLEYYTFISKINTEFNKLNIAIRGSV